MRICHATPHLPPDQAANALLPFHLGWWARNAGDDPVFVAHPRRQAGSDANDPDLPGAVAWVAPPRGTGRLGRALKIDSALTAWRIARSAAPLIASADIVHVHSNGLLAEYCASLAVRAGKPVVLTLYGTEIWHYRPKRIGPDLFTRAYRTAAAVTFYSRGLRDHAVACGLDRDGLHVVYPPVAETFQAAGRDAQLAARAAIGLDARHVLLNVKRLHPLAGHAVLIAAMPAIVAAVPGVELVICGTGPLAGDLAAMAHRLGVDRHVHFVGLVDNDRIAVFNRAADLFVLPSLLEACPTVALEALACGTPVISSDNPGGVELHGLFGDDVAVVPRENPAALAAAVTTALASPRRTHPATVDTLEREFRPAAVARRFYEVYRQVLGAGRGDPSSATARPRVDR